MNHLDVKDSNDNSQLPPVKISKKNNKNQKLNFSLLNKSLYTTQFSGLKVLTPEGLVQSFHDNGMKDRCPDGKEYDDLTETEKDDIMKSFI